MAAVRLGSPLPRVLLPWLGGDEGRSSSLLVVSIPSGATGLVPRALVGFNLRVCGGPTLSFCPVSPQPLLAQPTLHPALWFRLLLSPLGSPDPCSSHLLPGTTF